MGALAGALGRAGAWRPWAAAAAGGGGPWAPWQPHGAAPLHASAGAGAPAAVQRASGAAPAAAAGRWIGAPTSAPRHAYKALLVDAAGTLLLPAERMTGVYLRYAQPYGCALSDDEVLQRFRRAYNTPWRGPLRYVGDGRPFWRFIVQQSTGCDSEEMFEQVYEHYTRPSAWALAPGAVPALERLRGAGVRLACVSNFDTRLRPLLDDLGVAGLFDAIIVSAEVGAEKPNPVIFDAALARLGTRPGDAVHVGDDRRNDVWGARDAGVAAWLWGVDVRSFDAVARRVLAGPAAAFDDDDERGPAERGSGAAELQLPGARGAAHDLAASRIMRRYVCWAVLLVAAAGAAAAAGPGAVTETRAPLNAKGETLVLDVGSLRFQGNHPIGPPLGRPDECAAACRAVAGCSGWTFCNASAGCGAGCDEFLRAHAKLATAAGENPTSPAASWYKLAAITSFGPWGQTSGCAADCRDGACTPTARWPRGLCTLKRLPDPARPAYWSQDPGEGWVSGAMVLPALCASAGAAVSAQTCAACLASRDAAGCLRCATAPQLQRGLLERVLAGPGALAPADGCAACFNLTGAARASCSACLLGGQPCAACALLTPSGRSGAAPDVAACVDCVKGRGATWTGPCTSCAGLTALPGKPDAVARCMGCLSRAAGVACADASWPPRCFNPEGGSGGGACAACVRDAADPEACVACVTRRPFSESCTACAGLRQPEAQARCYACARAAGTPYTTCADCLSYLTARADQDLCHRWARLLLGFRAPRTGQRLARPARAGAAGRPPLLRMAAAANGEAGDDEACAQQLRMAAAASGEAGDDEACAQQHSELSLATPLDQAQLQRAAASGIQPLRPLGAGAFASVDLLLAAKRCRAGNLLLLLEYAAAGSVTDVMAARHARWRAAAAPELLPLAMSAVRLLEGGGDEPERGAPAGDAGAASDGGEPVLVTLLPPLDAPAARGAPPPPLRVARPALGAPGAAPCPPSPRGGGLPEEAARFYAACILMALTTLHGRRILHRDIKPCNLLVFGDGYVKLADLGAACVLPPGGAARSRTGTAGYMAPEVGGGGGAGDGAGYGFAVDMWSLGVTIYQMVAGALPAWAAQQAPAPAGGGGGARVQPEPDQPAEQQEPAQEQPDQAAGPSSEFPAHFSPELCDLLSSLLSPAAAARPSIEEVQRSPWFAGFDWQALAAKTLEPPALS
ncbi:kin-1 [Scenedesmus sp. PABB004]|nr:kin-1 [Scenedesmus sp. PABB004]